VILQQHHSSSVRPSSSTGDARSIQLATASWARFDSPAQAVLCAAAVAARGRSLEIEIRAGIHTGECEQIEEKLTGITVHIAARVTAKAAPSEVLVSHTVKDLVAGSELRLEDAGEHELKRVPGNVALISGPALGTLRVTPNGSRIGKACGNRSITPRRPEPRRQCRANVDRCIRLNASVKAERRRWLELEGILTGYE
jgi:hypothetical protein